MLFNFKTKFGTYLLRLGLVISKNLIPTDFFSPRVPVSLKGIIIHDNKILLLKDENGTWDLPGGKLKKNEIPKVCIQREIKEETDLDIEVNEIKDALVKKINGWLEVFIVIYECKLISGDELEIKISAEHFDFGFFSAQDLKVINTHKEYTQLILSSLNRMRD